MNMNDSRTLGTIIVLLALLITLVIMDLFIL
jgi:hypothetical protein